MYEEGELAPCGDVEIFRYGCVPSVGDVVDDPFIDTFPAQIVRRRYFIPKDGARVTLRWKYAAALDEQAATFPFVNRMSSTRGLKRWNGRGRLGPRKAIGSSSRRSRRSTPGHSVAPTAG